MTQEEIQPIPSTDSLHSRVLGCGFLDVYTRWCICFFHSLTWQRTCSNGIACIHRQPFIIFSMVCCCWTSFSQLAKSITHHHRTSDSLHLRNTRGWVCREDQRQSFSGGQAPELSTPPHQSNNQTGPDSYEEFLRTELDPARWQQNTAGHWRVSGKDSKALCSRIFGFKFLELSKE